MGPFLRHPLLRVTLLACLIANCVRCVISLEVETCEVEGNCSVGSGSRRLDLDQYRREEVIGNVRYQPSFGIYPKGCKWRVFTTNGSSEVGYQV